LMAIRNRKWWEAEIGPPVDDPCRVWAYSVFQTCDASIEMRMYGQVSAAVCGLSVLLHPPEAPAENDNCSKDSADDPGDRRRETTRSYGKKLTGLPPFPAWRRSKVPPRDP
jgi:hypothetical protein